jgi:hypothetical protein
MTVPGKGGRPRKWRSDADRQRAWRARTNGTDEPPTMVQALDDGDELATAWETIRDLGRQLEAAKHKAKALQVELNRTRRQQATEDRRWGWLTTENQHLQQENQRLRTERDDALTRLHDLETRPRQPPPPAAPTATPPPAAAPGLSRAERRRLEREQHRRR